MESSVFIVLQPQIVTTGMVKSSAFVISEPLDVPVVPKQVPLYSAKDPTKRVARAVLSIGRLFSAEAQALLARSLAQRVVQLLREGPQVPELQNALDALKPSNGWSAAAGIPQVLSSVETKGRTAIRLAVDGGHWEFVHPLIEACCNLRCPSQDLRSPLTAALEKGQVQALELEKLGFSQEQLQLVGELSTALKNAEQLEDMAPRLAFHFAPDSDRGPGSPSGSSERSHMPPLPQEASRMSVKATDWSPDIFILALDYCRNGRSRRTFLFQADASAAIWRVSLQLNLPALARKMAIWIGLSVPARSGDQSRSILLDAPLYGDDSILGRVVERAAEDAEWLGVARALLSVGASGTATCHGRPLYLFAQEQAEKKTRGFNDLLAPLLARIGQDVDQWRQPTVLVEERTAECPICFETLWTATPTAFVKLVEGAESIFHVNCAHFFCFDCASQQYMKQQSQQVSEYFCPICRAQAHEVMPMPDIAVNPRLWFQFLDVTRSGQVDQNTAVQALEAMLPIDTERLHSALQNQGFAAPWAKQGNISELHFWMPGGLLEWVRAHQHDLDRAKDRGKAPKLDELEEWLRHWDRERRGELDKGQVLRALCEVTKTSSLEIERIKKMKEGISAVWKKNHLKGGLTRQLCRQKPQLGKEFQQVVDEVLKG
ncbi:unnamed protein product [Cladocopium goreaui]|uniref:RING-type domain-containing protein n=1 Tax=Cladocopium goreaui TaxID=2562237 RepID=A0A9P1FHS9_9DINO|nr:unnamed protein product [Cladocopium goreaui]